MAAAAPRRLDDAWVPSDEILQASNLSWLMQQAAVGDYASLHAWSTRHRDRYWETVIERLKVRFREAPQMTLDITQGPENAHWFVGARLNITDSCFQAAPESVAIIEQQEGGPIRQVTLGELDQRSQRIAEALAASGIGVGDSVGLILPMTSDAVAIYLGVLRLGAVAVGIPESFSAKEMAVRLNLANTRLVFTQTDFQRGGRRHAIYERVQEAEAPASVVLPGPSGNLTEGDLRAGDLSWESYLQRSAGFVAPALSPESPINVLFSSGTTGEPKAIPWDQLAPIKCAADAHFHHDIHPGDVLAWPTSMGWMMGPWLIFASLLNRATMALYSGAPTELEFANFVESAHVTMLGTVPSLISAWRSRGVLDHADWSGIRCFSSTGECSRPDDMRWLMQAAGGRPIIEYCGGTEIAGGYITGTVVQPAFPSTFSTPALGIDFVILDEDGQRTNQGELFLIPPSVGLSSRLLNRDHHEIYYDGCPVGPSGETLRRHGDAMERLSNGYWRAHGRVDDTMNLGGIKVSSAEIERVLNRLATVRETAAVAEQPAGGGPSQLVIYAVTDGSRPAPELERDMQDAIRRELSPLFRLARLEMVDALPRTASNKVMRRLLRSPRVSE